MKAYNQATACDRMKQLRVMHNLSQSQMAEKLGEVLTDISEKLLVLSGESGKQVISQFERCKRNPSINVLFAYCNIFGVDINYMTGWADTPISDSSIIDDKMIADHQRLNAAYQGIKAIISQTEGGLQDG